MASWVKGQSGNPGGRPKALRTVVELARKRTTKAIQALTQIMLTSKDDSARVKAASVLLDRGWGKAPQQIDIRHKASPRNMTAQEIEARLEELKGGENAH